MMNTHGLKYVQSKGFCWVEKKSEKKKQIDKGGGGLVNGIRSIRSFSRFIFIFLTWQDP